VETSAMGQPSASRQIGIRQDLGLNRRVLEGLNDAPKAFKKTSGLRSMIGS
jgi:hypothetical protein